MTDAALLQGKLANALCTVRLATFLVKAQGVPHGLVANIEGFRQAQANLLGYVNVLFHISLFYR